MNTITIFNIITDNLIESGIDFDGRIVLEQIEYFINRPSIAMVNIVANILAGSIWATATTDQINLLTLVISDDINRQRLGIVE